jgi:hypothetical protein
MKLCERHRILGNYLFQEGLYPKAAEQYQLVGISTYNTIHFNDQIYLYIIFNIIHIFDMNLTRHFLIMNTAFLKMI